MPLQAEQILSALSAVVDPDLGRDIVSLGFIKNLEIGEHIVKFDLELTTPACPVKDDLKRQCEQRVLALGGLQEVQVRLSAKPKTAGHAQHENLKKVGCILAVSSCKGGVGKSTVAVNIAVSLANSGARVGLLDADIYGPSQPTLLGVADHRPRVEAQKFIPIEVCGIKMMSAGFLFPPAEAAVLRGPMVTNVLQQILFLTSWGELDYLIIDMPPGTGDVQLTLTQSLALNGAVIVTTPQKISLIDVGKGIHMFSKVNVPILGIIENMSYFDCGKCSERHQIFGPSGTPHLAQTYGLDIIGELPFETGIVAGSDRGRPPAADPASPVAGLYRDICGRIVGALARIQLAPASFPSVNIEW